MSQIIISIIIPVLNEAEIIERTLEQIKPHPQVEIIVVDGGSEDETVKLVRDKGVRVAIANSRGRAVQMNLGAEMARGEILLFLHGDTQLPDNYFELVQKTLKTSQAIAGAFALKIDGQKWSLRLIEIAVKLRSHFFSLPYGDQALFLKKQTFQKISGFAELPIMEDFELVQRLKSQGKIAIAPNAAIVSSRRWQKLGVWQTTAINQLIILGYYLGISPEKLRNFYRNFGKKHSSS